MTPCAAARAEQPIVFSLWHGHLLPLLYHHRGEGVAVLISEHADGEIIARIAESLGYRTVRGSTSRGAARALLGLARVLSDGGRLAVTPDGPRGPAKLAPASPIVAQRTGAPVIGAAASRASRLATQEWDRFRIPQPFAGSRSRTASVRVDADDAREAADDVDRVARGDGRGGTARAMADRRARSSSESGTATTTRVGVARTLLTPAERVFGGIVGARDILYDAGWLPATTRRFPR